MKQTLQPKKRFNFFFVASLLLFFSISTYSHVTEIRVNQNQDGSLTWYLQTYHHRGQCGIANSGININGTNYPIVSEHSGSIAGLSSTIFAQHSGIAWGRSSYAIVQTPYIPGVLNVNPYSTNVCWAFLVGGNGSFTPPPPPVCTSFPITSATTTIGATNDNGTPCDLSDDTAQVSVVAGHLACGNITGDKKFQAYLDSNGSSTYLGEYDYNSGITTPIGNVTINSGQSYTVRFVDNDFAGAVYNQVTPSFSGVLESTPPTISLNGASTETVAINGIYNDPGATASDDCGSATVNVSGAVNTSVVGTYTLSYTAVDPSGNLSSTVSRTVNVIPIFAKAKDITVSLDANGNVTIQPSDLDDGSILGGGTLSLDKSSFDCSNVGDNSVILTVTSGGSSVSDVANVFVKDITTPTVVTQDISINLDTNGNATITTDMVDNGSTDACGIQSYALDITSFSCANVGANEVALTVTDNNGNTAIGTANITINDVTPANVVTQDISIDLDANGNAIITTDMIDNGSTDACGIQSYALDTTSFSCSDTGVNEVILTVTDINGNISTATSNVTVNDVTNPTVVTQSATVTLANGEASISTFDVDGGTFDNCSFTLSLDNDRFTCSDIGENTVTLTATDASGNMSSQTAIVNVVGDIPTVSINDFNAVQTQKKNTIFLGFGPQSINLSTVTSGGSGFTYEWTTSTGEIVSNEANPSISPEVSTTYNVTVTNSNGCTASTSLYVCVIDARAFDKKGRYKGKVVVCHHTNGKKGTKHVTISISKNAVMTHLTKHGVGTDHADTLGGCDAQCTSNNNARSASKTITNTNSTPSLGDDLIVFPNPSEGLFDVKLKSISSNTNVYLFDSNGKLIERKLIRENVSSENIITIGNYNLSSGFYLLKIINQNETITKKLIVTKD